MACVLYEAAFTVVTKWFRARRRQALTAVTLVGGFASFVFSPLSNWLIDVQGWRQALITLALSGGEDRKRQDCDGSRPRGGQASDQASERAPGRHRPPRPDTSPERHPSRVSQVSGHRRRAPAPTWQRPQTEPPALSQSGLAFGHAGGVTEPRAKCKT